MKTLNTNDITKRRHLPAEAKPLCHNPSLTLLAKAEFALEDEQHQYTQSVSACQCSNLIGRVRWFCDSSDLFHHSPI